ncbi:hypothetical protein J3A74_000101 [Rhodococcus sp. PvP104]|nr:hypothetical protein [Rhodococcus sp. PvP104]
MAPLHEASAEDIDEPVYEVGSNDRRRNSMP